MSTTHWTDEQLRAYLNESGSIQECQAIEREVRVSESLQKRLSLLVDQQDHGLLSVGQVWRQERLSCPTREEWLQFELGVVEAAKQGWMAKHLNDLSCSHCLADVSDIQQVLRESQKVSDREQRLFESSVGHFLSQQHGSNQ